MIGDGGQIVPAGGIGREELRAAPGFVDPLDSGASMLGIPADDDDMRPARPRASEKAPPNTPVPPMTTAVRPSNPNISVKYSALDMAVRSRFEESFV